MNGAEDAHLPPELRASDTSEFSGVDLTEVGVSDALIASYGAHLKFNHSGGYWLGWDGDRWKRDEKGGVFELLKRILRAASKDATGNKRRAIQKAAFVAGAERLARSEKRVAVTSEMLDADPMVLACPGVYVDLETGEASSPTPDKLITKLAGIAPSEGSFPQFARFLDEATGADEEMVRFLQVLMGYILTGRTSEHVLVFLFGPGGNGKSVLVNLVTRILGEYAVTAAMDTFVASRGDRHTTELAMLAGARLVSASETQEGRSWDEPRIKSLTGGDPITARFMRQDNFTFIPQFKLILTGNHQPVLRNVDAAMRRRVLIAPFTRTPPRPDADLEDKLWAEAPQILRWAIRGCLEWQEEGLPRPLAIRAATDSYFSDMDLFGEWITEKCEVGVPGDTASAAALYAS